MTASKWKLGIGGQQPRRVVAPSFVRGQGYEHMAIHEQLVLHMCRHMRTRDLVVRVWADQKSPGEREAAAGVAGPIQSARGPAAYVTCVLWAGNDASASVTQQACMRVLVCTYAHTTLGAREQNMLGILAGGHVNNICACMYTNTHAFVQLRKGMNACMYVTICVQLPYQVNNLVCSDDSCFMRSLGRVMDSSRSLFGGNKCIIWCSSSRCVRC